MLFAFMVHSFCVSHRFYSPPLQRKSSHIECSRSSTLSWHCSKVKLSFMFSCHALLASDVAPAEQAFKAGADRDHQADDHRCDREHPGGLFAKDGFFAMSSSGANRAATSSFPLVLTGKGLRLRL